jgi:glutathione synthase/RimK-type ligase-like ATP-grasp enzyme
MSILILRSDPDPCADLVRLAVEERGGRILSVDTGQFPTDAAIWIDVEDWKAATIDIEGSSLSMGEVAAVWIRHVEAGAGLPADLDPAMRKACRSQSISSLWSLLECLPVFQLDPVDALRRAPYKPRQIQLARALGLDVPRTLLTNDPDAVRSFAATCLTGLVTKMVTSSIQLETTSGLETVYTRVVEPEELAYLEGLDLCPMLFQERVPKAQELRITVVGSRMFAAAIDSSTSEAGVIDWRRDPALVGSFRPYDRLPEPVQARIFDLLDRLALNFATVDMILTPDGRYVFLEVNTISFFAFVERATGLPISAAVADLLLGRSAPRI